MNDLLKQTSLDTFPKLLIKHVSERPNHDAIREKDLGIWQSWTWSQAAEEIRLLAGGLASLGLGRNDKLAIIGENGVGKTTLIKEICKQLGVIDTISSPTYSIVNEYKAKIEALGN